MDAGPAARRGAALTGGQPDCGADVGFPARLAIERADRWLER